MKNVVSNLYADYLRYIDKFRAIPWETDVLKPVERRTLLSVHDVAKGKFVKSSKVTGYCISQYHPHGDIAVYDTLVGLVQQGYVEGQGNWGSDNVKDYIKAASPRYSECKTVNFIDNGFSEFLNFVPWSEFEYEKEPHYLPFHVPIGLIGHGLIHGISLHTTKIPKFKYLDLLSRLYSLLTGEDKKTIVANFLNSDVFEDKPGEFENILTNGNGIIFAVPKYVLKNNSIYIYGKNPLNGFSKLDAYNEKYEDTNGKPFATIIDSSDSKLEVIISPFGKRNNITKEFVSTVMDLLIAKIHIICNVVTADGSVKKKGIDSLLLNSYNKWKDAYIKKLNHDLSNLIIKENELNIVLIIRAILQSNPGISKIEEICKLNTSNFTNEEILEVIKKYTIKQLIEAKIDIPNIQKKISEIKLTINNIDNIAIQRLKECMKN